MCPRRCEAGRAGRSCSSGSRAAAGNCGTAHSAQQVAPQLRQCPQQQQQHACQPCTRAPCSAAATQGVKPFPHIMVPLVGFEEELSHQVGLAGLGTTEQCGWLMGVGRMSGFDTWCTGAGLHCTVLGCKPAPELNTAPLLNCLDCRSG